MGLSRQAVNQVRDNLRLGTSFPDSLDRLYIELIRMGTIDEIRGLLTGGLKPLAPRSHACVQTGQQSEAMVSSGKQSGRVPILSQRHLARLWLYSHHRNHFKLLMCIGEVLEIDQILANIWPLAVYEVNFLVKLLTNGRIRRHNGIHLTPETVQDVQPPCATSTIPIGTVGEARINRHLKVFSLKSLR